MAKKPNQQTTNHIFMVRPANFGFNEETADNNAFQTNDLSMTKSNISKQAIKEFDDLVARLRDIGVHVIVGEEAKHPVKPDSVFPNNWVTFHEDGTVMTYPMYAPLRRKEQETQYLEQIGKDFQITRRIRWEKYEAENRFLEGTGSMIFDRKNQIVYACLSPRTHIDLLDNFYETMDCKGITFQAVDASGQDIYHTNVMMALGETFVVICVEAIKYKEDLERLLTSFEATGKEVISISLAQMMAFAGNMLQVRTKKRDTYLVMSEQAFQSLSKAQIDSIERHTNILYSPIPTIETYGGGSVRCMMAEVFLPKRE